MPRTDCQPFCFPTSRFMVIVLFRWDVAWLTPHKVKFFMFHSLTSFWWKSIPISQSSRPIGFHVKSQYSILVLFINHCPHVGHIKTISFSDWQIAQFSPCTGSLIPVNSRYRSEFNKTKPLSIVVLLGKTPFFWVIALVKACRYWVTNYSKSLIILSIFHFLHLFYFIFNFCKKFFNFYLG